MITTAWMNRLHIDIVCRDGTICYLVFLLSRTMAVGVVFCLSE
ncbi:MAG TPA: hypothetical protein VHV83_17125 [Armatimonadota bacterium]|nr:hypothetical protein [Armatimonadota bacterium]